MRCARKTRHFLQKYLSRHLGERQFRFVERSIYGSLFGRNLSELAVAFNTEKFGGHYYTQHYQRHFGPIRKKKLNILEIGVGGYDDPKAGGESLRMWKAFFPKSSIYGIDIYDKSFHDEERIRTFRGSQIDPVFLREVTDVIGTIDIIIDDGSHYNEHVIATFKLLFPLLSPGGVYVVEDLQTSYWERVVDIDWGGSRNLAAPYTSMNFFKPLADGLNYEEFTIDGYKPTYFDTHIIAMHFYHNILFIKKGTNREGSNILGKRYSDVLNVSHN